MNRLSVRLFLSHVLVAVIGAVTTYVVVRLLAPDFFETRVQGMGPMMGNGQGPGFGQRLHDSFVAALDSSLVIGLLISAAFALVAAGVASRRLVRTLRAMRRATHRLAAGHYDERVTPPAEVELAELVNDVNDLAASLADTEQMRVRLLSDVAHEMRTPLTVIDGYVEGIVDGVFPADAATLRPVTEELDRLRRLTDDLSALSRTSENRLDLHRQPLDLAEIAARAAERLRPRFEEAGVTLTVEPAGEPGRLTVDGDADRLTQVFTNLLGNALRSVLGSRTPGPAVRVRSRREDGWAVVDVEDTGVGLAHEDLERVFERFYRVAGTDSVDRRGSGIGLTIARGIVRAHGGDVTASSQGTGTGATFTVKVPVLSPR